MIILRFSFGSLAPWSLIGATYERLRRKSVTLTLGEGPPYTEQSAKGWHHAPENHLPEGADNGSTDGSAANRSTGSGSEIGSLEAGPPLHVKNGCGGCGPTVALGSSPNGLGSSPNGLGSSSKGVSPNGIEPCASKVVASSPVGLPLLSTGDLARGCETTVRTIRFYEEAGLVEPVARSEGGHRMFEPAQLLRLQLIMDLREAGLSLQDIKALFDLKATCDTPEKASTQLATALEAQIECMQRKIAVLRRLREELASTVAVIRECNDCDEPDFHEQCDGCDVMNRPDLPRAMKLLWAGKNGGG
jgi:MerR family Zn(II)-responsive transcriptional regulator of zntA